MYYSATSGIRYTPLEFITNHTRDVANRVHPRHVIIAVSVLFLVFWIALLSILIQRNQNPLTFPSTLGDFTHSTVTSHAAAASGHPAATPPEVTDNSSASGSYTPATVPAVLSRGNTANSAPAGKSSATNPTGATAGQPIDGGRGGDTTSSSPSLPTAPSTPPAPSTPASNPSGCACSIVTSLTQPVTGILPLF